MGTYARDTREPARDAVQRLSPWFHNLHLPDGTQTAPRHPLGDFPTYKWEQLGPHLPADLEGWTALDIGCNAGFYGFELARRGAKVTGIDSDGHYLDQARWAARQYGLQAQVEFRRMQVYDLARAERTWDLVLFMGVLYHLRYPLLALDLVARCVRRLLVFQTLTMPGQEVERDTYDRGLNDRECLLSPGWPKAAFIEHRFGCDLTNWWFPNHACVEAMLRSSGLRILGRPAPEFYLAEPDPTNPSSVTTWNRAELLAATGRPWRSEDEDTETANGEAAEADSA